MFKKKKKDEEEEKKENHNTGWKVDENEKGSMHIHSEYSQITSGNLRLAISRLLRGSLRRTSVSQFPK